VRHAELRPAALELQLMAMPGSTQVWTREMVLALPDDGNRYELFDGELLVTPSPGPLHQWALSCLWNLLAPYIHRNQLGFVMASPADLHLGGKQLSQPDLFVTRHPPPHPTDWSLFPNPILVVEILSPSSAHADRFRKRRVFQLAGIPEYWIVDLDGRNVERWKPGDERAESCDEIFVWHPEGAAEPLEIDLPRFFRQVHGT
jgi:Uma2 family endonuclease